MAQTTHTDTKGISLVKGPVGILGLVGTIYGVGGLLFASRGFALHIPHGAVHGTHWIGLLVNGWSELLFIAAGLALLLAAPLHWGAKGMSLLVGLVLLAAAIVAVIRGDGVFGIFAANHLTEVIWAAAGILLLILALLPRVGRRSASGPPSEPRTTRRHPTELAGDGEPLTRRRTAQDAPAAATEQSTPRASGAHRVRHDNDAQEQSNA